MEVLHAFPKLIRTGGHGLKHARSLPSTPNKSKTHLKQHIIINIMLDIFFPNSQWQGCAGSGSLTSGYLCQSVVLAANGNSIEVNEVGLVPAYTCVSVSWEGF